MPESVSLETSHGPVSGLVQGPRTADTLVVLAPGAGAPITHPFMEQVGEGLAEKGFRVARFNFVYMDAGKRSPDRQPILEETFMSVLDALESERRDRKVVIGGKSMGGRIASHVVASGATADGLIFLGYPLHPPGRPERIRDAHLYDISVPMLFVEGTRDPFCPLETLERVRAKLGGPNDLVVIDDGDHSFRVRKSSGRSSDEALDEIVVRAAAWIAGLSSG